MIIQLQGPSAGVQKHPDGSGTLVFTERSSGTSVVIEMTSTEREALRMALGSGPVIEMPGSLSDAALRAGQAKARS